MKRNGLIVLMMIVSMCTFSLAGCTNREDKLLRRDAVTESSPIVDSEQTSSKYKYTVSLNDIDDEVKKEIKKDYFIDYTETFKVQEFEIKVNNLTYERSTVNLIDNYYVIPSDTTVSDGIIDSEHIIVLVDMTIKNSSNKSDIFATNTFNIYSLTSTNPADWLYSYTFYQSNVESPSPENRKYACMHFEPQETKEVTVGFIAQTDIQNTQNNYLIIGTTGSTSDPLYWVKLPEESVA